MSLLNEVNGNLENFNEDLQATVAKRYLTFKNASTWTKDERAWLTEFDKILKKHSIEIPKDYPLDKSTITAVARKFKEGNLSDIVLRKFNKRMVRPGGFRGK